MVPYDRSYGLQRPQPGAQRVADDRMLAHDARLLRVELAALEQHAVGHRDFPDVVQEATAIERAKVRFVEAERTAERGRVCRKTLAMSARVRVARFNRRAQSQNHRFRGFELVGISLQTDEGANARVQLRHIEGLADEIVGAGIDPIQTILRDPPVRSR